MAKKYEIRWCWNGSKRQVESVDTYESKKEWEWAIDHIPNDFLDANDHIAWVDNGDNDDWE